MNKKALLVIDVQNDFCKGGSLAVDGGELIIPYVNSLMSEFDLVVGTKDWHPQNHSSFMSNNKDGVWPDHCVKETSGAELHPDLNKEGLDFIWSKGSNPKVDSYSGFFENDKVTSTGLGEFLKLKGVNEALVVGLALDYCVKATAIDALKFGLDVTVDLKGTKAVNLNDGDDKLAIEELLSSGVKVVGVL